MTPLIKITAPRPLGVAPRERAFRLLDDGLKRGAAWIASPAGSGKTTLIASYLEARNIPCLWYHVDNRDADLATFFYYLGLAAKKTAPRFRKPLPLLTPEYLMGVSVFARRFFEEFYKRLKPPFAIVVDDYQEISAGAAFHDILNLGLSIAPDGIHILVLSRSTAPPAYTRMIANNRIARLGWEDVRLTEEESRQIVRGRKELQLTSRMIDLLHEKTQGWVAGMVLLMESAKSRPLTPELLDGFTSAEIFGYFATEILCKASLQEQEFLLLTAFLPSMSVQMTESLTGNAAAEKILLSLYNRNFFTECHFKDHHMVFVYHPLFREFLMDEGRKRISEGERAAIQQKAAALLIDEGDMESAAALLVDAGDWKALAAVVLKQAPALIARGRSMTIEEWLARIPLAALHNDPWLLYWKGVSQLAAHPAQCRAYLEDAFRLFESSNNDAGMLLAWSAIVATFLFEFDDFRPLDRWIDWLDDYRRSNKALFSPEIEAGVAAGMTGALTWRRPSHPDMRAWVEKALALSSLVADSEASMRAYTNGAVHFIWAGMFHECAILIREMEKSAGPQNVSPLRRIIIKNTQAMFYNTSTEFRAQAQRAVLEGMQIAQETGVRIIDPLLCTQGVISSLNEGDLHGAEEFLHEIDRNQLSGSRTHSSHYFCLAGWHQLLSKNTRQAVLFAEKSLALNQETGVPVTETIIRVLLAHTLHATGEHSEAKGQLAHIKTIQPRTASAYFEYLCLLTEAYFLFEGGEQSAGYDFLQQALTKGRRNGFCTKIYFWLPVVMTRLCTEALEAGIEVAYAQALIRDLGLIAEVPPIELQSWPWPVKIYTLGDFEVIKDDKPLVFPVKAPRKIIALLKFLIACGKKGASQERVADLLWPNADGDTALQSLATGIHRLRQLLGSEQAIVRRDGNVKMGSGYCWIDAHAFETLLEETVHPISASSASPDPLWRTVHKAISLYKGAFLSESGEGWAISYRERLRVKYLRAIKHLGGHYADESLFMDAIEIYQKGLQIDALVEDFYYRIMKCFAAAGRRAEAMAVYKQCKRILNGVLGVDPCAEIQALYSSVSAPHP